MCQAAYGRGVSTPLLLLAPWGVGGGVARSSKPIASTVVGDPTLQVVPAERPLIEEHLHDAEHLLGVRKE